ncbi:MAG TPA: hypothetical protein VN886_21605 [Acidimicrobiales bacterium]|jgi:hypothetical protein|nr:hypothetical protein [Acidimicrobiales bacterium]
MTRYWLLGVVAVLGGCAVGVGAWTWHTPWIIAPYVAVVGGVGWFYRRHLTT